MKTVRLLCSQVYQWNKRDFWILNISCVFSGAIVYFYDLNPLFVGLLIICLLLKVFSFVRGASVMPALGADTHQFSWKYMQSMPLNKKEILIFFMLTNFMSYLPLWIWFASFQPVLFDVLELNGDSFISVLRIHAFFILTIFIITPITLCGLIQFPRQQFSRNNDKTNFYERIKKVVMWICGLIYAICAVYYFETEYDINLLYPLTKILDLLRAADNFIATHFVELESEFFLLAGEFILLYAFSRQAIRLWQNETLSYVQITWKARRDVPVIVACLILMTLPFHFQFFNDKEHYRKDPLLKQVYLGNMSEAVKLIESETPINFKNKYGATVLMAAAENGNVENFKLLEKMGASREGKLKQKGHPDKDVFELAIQNRRYSIAAYLLENGYVPKKDALVKVVSHCNTRLIDLLIAKGIDINEVNSNGESALHLAARYDCFRAVVTLIELGADINLKEPGGKTAYGYITRKDSDLAFYLEKKTRSPAGK